VLGLFAGLDALIAIPALWYVVVAALAVGFVVAAILQIAHHKPTESAKLSLKI
jgi:hypothetical protein